MHTLRLYIWKNTNPKQEKGNGDDSYYFPSNMWTMDHFFFFFYVGNVQYMEISGWYLLVSGTLVYHP